MILMKRLTTALALLATLALLSSCADNPSDVAPHVPPSEEMDVPVPTVDAPLDAAGVDPCAVLASDRLTRLGVSDQSARDFSNENAGRCAWKAVDNSFMLDLAVNVEAGLRFPYSIKGSFLSFQETEIDGYPAVNVDPVTAPTCSFWVGLAETQSFSAGASSLSTSAPPLCEKAEALAVEVIDALRNRS
ncbi:DUF3558 domain-containing protein [Pseudonocardia sp. NPDC049154]|uniref:DUF3558 domain-containing protein n=1 Tax=Pseudonocardia sp. NPDC049154 TaxID=3155501 RepID=UPI0033C29494